MIKLNDVSKTQGVEIKEWLTCRQTKNLIIATERSLGTNKEVTFEDFGSRGRVPKNLSCIRTVSGRHGGGTFVHETLALSFLMHSDPNIELSILLSIKQLLQDNDNLDGFIALFSGAPSHIKTQVQQLKDEGHSVIQIITIMACKFKIKRVQYHESKKQEYIYLYITDHATKIGMSLTPNERAKSISTGCPYTLNELFAIPVENMQREEASLHKKYKSKRQNGEWFALSEQDIQDIKLRYAQK